MINISANSKQLDIILPNTNRALAEVIKNATPKELEILSQSKDLKSVMNSLLKQTSDNSSSNKILLNLLKNNPTLKSLGSVSNSVKDLLNAIKSTQTELKGTLQITEPKTQLPIEKQLKNFLVDIKNLSEPILKQKIENSGVFLESRLKNMQNPQVEVKSIIDSLSKLLDKSKIFNVGVLNNQLKDILDSKVITQASSKLLAFTSQESSKELSSISKKIEGLIIKFQEHQSSSLNKNDVITSKDVAAQLNRLSTLNSQTQLLPQKRVEKLLSNDLKAIITKASEEIAKSDNPNKIELLKHIDKLALQIDYHQLLSHLSHSSSLYIPFSWEALKEGNIELKEDKDKNFYCDINLTLKEYGELNLKLTLYDKNQLNVHIYSDSITLKEIIKENISSLRSALIENQITPREIRLFDNTKRVKSSVYEENSNPIDIGFEVKV